MWEEKYINNLRIINRGKEELEDTNGVIRICISKIPME